jgi:hypothetical protein
VFGLDALRLLGVERRCDNDDQGFDLRAGGGPAKTCEYCASRCACTIKRCSAWASQQARYLTGAGFGVTRAGEGVA